MNGKEKNQTRSEEHTSELQSRRNLVCRLLLEKKKEETTSDHEIALLTVRRLLHYEQQIDHSR